MSKGFSVDDILGEQSKALRPAGCRMDIVMLPISQIKPNPANVIYDVGDVGMLQADIAEHGLRTPLEVTPDDGDYMLVAGHRRWTACSALHEGGDGRFESLPCIIRRYGSEDEELVALITSNATARELTDGERLRQYVALKGALTRLKAAGKVEGRVRDELTRRTGEGAGTLGRLNAIAAHCVPEVQEMLERGEITLTRAYECSKLYKVQQVFYAKMGYSRMPGLSDTEKDEVKIWLVDVGLAEYLKDKDYVRMNEWNYCDHGNDFDLPCTNITLKNGDLVQVFKSNRTIFCAIVDEADHEEHLAESTLYLSDLFPLARKKYVDRDKLKKYKEKVKEKDKAEKARQSEQQYWHDAANAVLSKFDTWKKVAEAKPYGLTFREWPMIDGGVLVVGVDELTRRNCETGIPYFFFVCARFDSEGKRVGRYSGDVNDQFIYKSWIGATNLTLILAEDLKARRAKSEGGGSNEK